MLIDFINTDDDFYVLQARTGDANDGCAIFWKEKL